ncbi:MAG: response regulator [Bacteroidota bacterium]
MLLAAEILLVEDNPADIRLTQEVLADSKLKNNLHVVKDGAGALDFLYQRHEYADAPRPDLVLLDLNLPGVDGHQVLKTVKNDPALRTIPVVIMTTSSADEDILSTYENAANCYVTKPLDFDQFIKVVETLEEFWFTIVRLPHPDA